MCGNNNHRNWELISLTLAGEADEPGLKSLKELIDTDPLLAGSFHMLESWWNMKSTKDAHAFDLFFEKLLNRLPGSC
jgi:hypothetical protein